MPSLVLIAIVGLAAQLIDGALGMAYGATSATLLLAVGASPALASATVHFAEVGTTLVSGAAHTRFGNVDWRVVLPLALPGAAAAFLGAVVLSSIPGDAAKPYVAAFLLLLGTYVFVRFALGLGARRSSGGGRFRRRWLAPLGAIAGFLDAVGGGGWGPVTTSTLVASEKMEPRRVIGSVDTAEFLVALAASAGFLVGLGSQAINWSWVVALLAGGVIAAPIAAWLVRSLTPRLLGTGVGVVLVVTNGNTLANEFGASTDSAMQFVYATLAATTLLTAALLAARRSRLARASVAVDRA
ncbi:MAG: sulfite exporter TauE/SafE family protein [Chloroflexota bacterium]|nr:sulfite exporter TauE/SafE family protein [Chloroflexota bacterium]